MYVNERWFCQDRHRSANNALAGDHKGRRGKWVANPHVQWPPPLVAPEARRYLFEYPFVYKEFGIFFLKKEKREAMWR